MSTATRTSRRRRLLQEGISSQSISASDSDSSSDEAGQRPRYAPRPGSISFTLAAALPRTLGGLIGVGFLLLLPVASIAVLDWAVSQNGIEAASPLSAVGWTQATQLASIATWWSSTAWLMLSASALIVFGLRRRRMDDLQGGYRWWIGAAICCLALSLNATTHAHSSFAGWLAAQIGWSPLAGDSLWWLVPGVLILGGLSVRLFIDLLDSRLAATAMAVGLGMIGYSWLGTAQLAPMPDTSWATASSLLSIIALSGQAFLMISLISFMRRVVLEAEGAIAPPAKPEQTPAKVKEEKPAKRASEEKSVVSKVTPQKSKSTQREAAQEEAPKRERRSASKESQAEQENSGQESTVWTNGGDDFDEDYDDQPKRRLTKAERKRLRKQKARRAA